MQVRNYDSEPNLEYLFHPRSIAIIGVSSDTSGINIGQSYLQSLLSFGYKGKIYPVGRGGGEIFGLKIYPSINDIPDTVDYVISAIPARYIFQLITDCASKGVKTIQMFTAGFSELEDEEGKQLQAQLVATAQKMGVRIIGPNCFGLYYPKTGLSFPPCLPEESSKESSPVGFISQSGGNSVIAIREGAARGVYFSKVISYGNACDLDETDFLEYLTHDPEIRIIAIYIEGVKDGRRFIQALREASAVKPIIIYKGGITEGGARAAASHTGAMAGQNIIWNSLIRQVGAVQVDSMEGLLDIVLLFMHMAPPKGRNTAIMGVGGGFSVQAADACSTAGLTVPMLPAEIRRGLKEIYTSEVGGSHRNPVDMYWDREDLFKEAIRIVAGCDQTDLLILHISFVFASTREGKNVKPYIESIVSLSNEINKRTAIVFHSIWVLEATKSALETQQVLSKAGFPVYFSMSQAANAISKFIQYHQAG